MARTASCSCGQLRIQVEGEPRGVGICHCLACQQRTGVGVFLFMRLVVLPWSAFPHPVNFRPLATTLDLLSHIFLFGIPIALAAREASPRGPTIPSSGPPSATALTH